MLFMQAANYLNIKSLLDLTCLTVANMIKGSVDTDNHNLQSFCAERFLVNGTGKTPEEIRKTFNIVVNLNGFMRLMWVCICKAFAFYRC